MSAEEELKSIYGEVIREAGGRLEYASAKLSSARAHSFKLEEAALHLRKATELIAFAAIAPNKIEYAEIRKKAKQAADFTKDYHAKRIFQDLARIRV